MTSEVYSGRAVRRAAWQFLTGKAASGLLTFGILLWLVRTLPTAEYGAYVVLVAGTELGFAIAGFGLPWLSARYLPAYRLHADGPTLGRFCRRLVYWQMLAIVALAGGVALAMNAYLDWVDLLHYRVAAWFALGLLIAEGMARFMQEVLLAQLMLQWQARLSLLLRQLAFLGVIAALSASDHAQVAWVLAGELTASILGWLVAGVALLRHLHDLRGQSRTTDWQEPHVAEQLGIALRMHVAYLMTLTSGPQVFLNLAQRALGAESAALFGFLQTLYKQVVRYLPATLFFSVLRPKLMASFLSGGMTVLASQANLAGKLSLFILIPLVVFVALGGDFLVAMVSGGKFQQGGALLLGLMFVALPFSQRQLIESVAVSTNRSGLCTLGSALSLLALPLMLWLLDSGYGLWAPVVGMLAGQVAFNITVTLGLAPFRYRPDWVGGIKLACSGLLAWFGSWRIISTSADDRLWSLALASASAAAVYLLIAWCLKPFTADERDRINAMAGRRVFVW